MTTKNQKPEQLELLLDKAKLVKDEKFLLKKKDNFYIAPLKEAIMELVLFERHLKYAKSFKQPTALYHRLETMKNLLLKENATYRYADEILESIREVNRKK